MMPEHTFMYEDRESLILKNIPLVLFLASRFKRSLGYNEFCHNWEDIVQEGTLGLIKAIDRFNPDRGIKFSAYAGRYIIGYIQTMIAHRSFFVKICDEDMYNVRYEHILQDIDNCEIIYNPEDYINHNIDNKRYIKFIKQNIDERKFDIMYTTEGLGEIDEIMGNKYNITRSRIGQIKDQVYKKLTEKMKSKFGAYRYE